MCCRRQRRHRRHHRHQRRPLAVCRSRALSSTFPHCSLALLVTLSLSLSQMFHLLANFMPAFSKDFDQSKSAKTYGHMYERVYNYICVQVHIYGCVRAYIACIYACVSDLTSSNNCSTATKLCLFSPHSLCIFA